MFTDSIATPVNMFLYFFCISSLLLIADSSPGITAPLGRTNMKLLMRKYVCFLFIFLVFICCDTNDNNIESINAIGNTTGQEIGDAVYRVLVQGTIVNSHAGIYYRYIGGDPQNSRNHLIINQPGFDSVYVFNRLCFNDWNDQNYLGAYVPKEDGTMTIENR